MHPAPSLVAFTTLSGLGFGLIAWLGLAPPDHPRVALAALAALALGLTGAGLLASLLHLGNPRRFLKAFSQWRSSWLSREAVLAMAALTSFALYAGFWIIGGLRVPPLGWLAAGLALATVLATAMIYAQLRTVPRWRSPLTPALFLAAALGGGALLAGAAGAAVAILPALALLQAADWITGDRRLARAGSTLATATGLGPLGRLRQLKPPHTGRNYLLDEMVFVLGRRHARGLRAAGLALAALLPLGLLLAAPAGHGLVAAAAGSHLAGMIILRWLFFAEAEHVVGFYYGRR